MIRRLILIIAVLLSILLVRSAFCSPVEPIPEPEIPNTVHPFKLNLGEPVKAVEIAVVRFKNSTGDDSLDWISFGLDNAITNDLINLKGVDARDSVETMPYQMFPTKLTFDPDRAVMIKNAKENGYEYLWTGEYSGSPDSIILEFSVINVTSGEVVTEKQLKTHLSSLLKDISRNVISAVRDMGITIDKDERERLTRTKTGSVAAWKLNSEWYMQLSSLNENFRNYGDNEEREGIILKAMDAAEQAVKRAPDYAVAWRNLGISRFILPETEEAERTAIEDKSVEAFERALQIDPDDIISNVLMSVIVDGRNERGRAAKYLVNIININPVLLANDVGYELVAEELYSTGRMDEVMELMVYLKNSSIPDFADVAKVLIAKGEKGMIPLLIEGLKDQDCEIRAGAASALVEAKDKSTVPHLADALGDSDAEVRRYAVIALYVIKDSTVVPHLISALKDSEIQIRLFAAATLGLIGDERALPHLITMLREGEERERIFAACVLGDFNDDRALPALREALNDEEKSVREKAAESLVILEQ